MTSNTSPTTTTSTSATKSAQEHKDLLLAIEIRSVLGRLAMMVRMNGGLPSNPTLAEELLTQFEGSEFDWDTSFGSLADSLCEFIGDYDDDEASEDDDEDEDTEA